MTPKAALTKARKACLAIAGVEEKLSHGSPAWFTKKKQFAHFWDNHHGDGELCLWLYSDLEIQRALVDGDPDGYFVPPYVGSKGWIGVRLNRELPWEQINALIESAEAARRAKK
ncbi:MAG: MmcQ/YjbR family DNA-binding protein [Kofleriaceae bacterium]